VELAAKRLTERVRCNEGLYGGALTVPTLHEPWSRWAGFDRPSVVAAGRWPDQNVHVEDGGRRTHWRARSSCRALARIARFLEAAGTAPAPRTREPSWTCHMWTTSRKRALAPIARRCTPANGHPTARAREGIEGERALGEVGHFGVSAV